MVKKIKAIDIATDSTITEPVIEEPERKEEIIVEPPNEVIETVKEEDPINDVVIKIEEEKPINEEVAETKPSRKMITCPDCGKRMYERTLGINI